MSTPPNRRRPTPTPAPQPARRPQVAGLRKPGVQPSPRPRPTAPEEQAAPGQQSPQQPAPQQQTPQQQAPQQSGAPTWEPSSGGRPPAGPAPAWTPTGGAPARRRSPVNVFTPLAAGLGVVSVLLIVAAVIFGYNYFSVKNTLANKALVDPAATVEVKQSVTSAVESLFSYDYKDIAKTEKAANELLTNDKVRNVYNGLLGEVKRNAPKQKIVVTSRVSRIAVIDLGENSARLLVFVDQSSIREGTNQANSGGGQLTVSAERVDGVWKIADLDAYENRGN